MVLLQSMYLISNRLRAGNRRHNNVHLENRLRSRTAQRGTLEILHRHIWRRARSETQVTEHATNPA